VYLGLGFFGWKSASDHVQLWNCFETSVRAVCEQRAAASASIPISVPSQLIITVTNWGHQNWVNKLHKCQCLRFISLLAAGGGDLHLALLAGLVTQASISPIPLDLLTLLSPSYLICSFFGYLFLHKTSEYNIAETWYRSKDGRNTSKKAVSITAGWSGMSIIILNDCYNKFVLSKFANGYL
jgi:hypothetical protein